MPHDDDPHDRRRNKRGRPALDPGDPSVKLTASVPGRVFDRACHAATVRRINLAEWVREAVREKLDDDDHG